MTEEGADHALYGPQQAESVRSFKQDRSPPAWAVAFDRGSERVSVRAVSLRSDFGNNRAEVELENGTHVTIDTQTELAVISEVRD